jgi:DNA-binding GntR family transcriptional regulator
MDQHDQLIPLYEQVRRAILADIESGALAEGSFLPAEPELCAVHGVSRITLRRAISDLCEEGRLIRQQGRGTLVSPSKVRQTLVTLRGFTETMSGLGRASGHRILSCRTDADPAEIGNRLPAGSLIRFERVLERDGRPMTLETLWFSAARFPSVVEPVKSGGSFFSSLREKEGVEPAGAERQFDVGFPTSKERDVLTITSSQPVYRIEKTVFGENDIPISLSKLVTPCHLVTFTMRS